MSLESDLSARLLNAPALSSLSGRVDWMRRPGRALPAVTLQVVSDPRPQHYRGFQRVRPTQVQIDIWAAGAGEAAALREAVIATLTPAVTVGATSFQRAIVLNVRPGFEQQDASDGQPQGELYRQSIDFTFTHNA